MLAAPAARRRPGALSPSRRAGDAAGAHWREYVSSATAERMQVLFGELLLQGHDLSQILLRCGALAAADYQARVAP